MRLLAAFSEARDMGDMGVYGEMRLLAAFSEAGSHAARALRTAASLHTCAGR